MRLLRQIGYSCKALPAAVSMQRAAVFATAFLAFLFYGFSADAASGETVYEYAGRVGDSTNVLVNLFAYGAFIGGIILAALGVQELRKHVENPQVPLKHPLTKLGFGGLLLSLPTITGVVAETMAPASPFDFITMNAFTFNNTGSKSGSLSGLIANGINNGAVLVGVASFAAFIIGVWLTLRGIQMLRAHIDNPGNAPLAESLKRLGVGGALLSFPAIVNVVYETFGSFSDSFKNTGWSASGASAGGLDGMMVHFMGDITNVAYFGIEAFCYIAGTLMVLFAMQRLIKSAQDGPRGPLGFSTIMMFIVSGLLLSFPQLLSSIDASLLNTGAAKTNVSFMALSGAVNGEQVQNAKNVFSAVLAFMAVIGFLSVVRGLFILKAFADGNGQATMMSVVTHIVAGSLAINLGGLINAIQSSLGLSEFAVTFH